jgi:predicted TIM-barrel fold metal-dependent hydrolase
MYDAFLKPFCFGMAKCIMWGSRFPMRSLLAAVPSYAKEAREIVACAGIAGRGQGRRD